ncbi:MAG: HpaII family restriction endonuclease [Bacteroidales bacterium]
MKTGNKGEWSEIYALLKLIGDKRVFAGDGNLNKTDLFFPIDEVIRKEGDKKSEHYIIYNIKNSEIVDNSSNLTIELKAEEFSDKAKQLFDKLKSSPKGSKLCFEQIEMFLNTVSCNELKAKAINKADLLLVIHDFRISRTHKLGFSIKSQLGGSSTLLNASSDTTSFLYQVSGIDDVVMNKFNEINKDLHKNVFQKRFEILMNCDAEINFLKVISPVFNNNLIYQDTALPKILASVLLNYYQTPKSLIRDLCEITIAENPLEFDHSTGMDFYKYKIKQFLINSALGMTPGTPWNGIYQANGGYLVVKSDGDILCYHFYDRNELEDYLFNNTKLDTPSTSRHGFGTIYKDGNLYYIKLNIQIRFIH